MILRKYKTEDLEQITKLFYNTVHSVNSKNYSKEQLNVWATKKIDYTQWNKTLLENFSVVGLINDKIVGFGDIENTGYFNRLYVHMNYQNMGIATSICNRLEEYADKFINVQVITVHASITAIDFFKKRNYTVIKEQQVERSGILLKNFVMQKLMNF